MKSTSSVLLFFFFFFFIITSSIYLAQGQGTVHLQNLRHHELPLRVPGPESIAFSCDGAPYVGVADGVILRWDGSRWTEFAVTARSRPRALCDFTTNPATEHICGRPLGLKFDTRTCELYIADAYFGLMKTGRNGGVAQELATSAEGVPFRFLNALDIDRRTGMVYFTDTSTSYQRRQWQAIIRSGDRTGRLMQYNPHTNQVTVLLRGLSFPNGVALSRDGSFVLVTQTTVRNVLRLWLRGSRAGAVDVFLHTQGAPDNIVKNTHGDFWLAENDDGGRGKAVKIDQSGEVIDVVDGLNPVSLVEPRSNSLWIGSLVNSFVGVVDNYS